MTLETANRPGIGSFWHDLPREGKLLLSIVVFEFIGTGLVLPFNVVYLHEVRHFPLGDAGLLLSVPALAGFLVTGPGGRLIDAIGARRVLIGASSSVALGEVVMALARSEPAAALALTLSGLAFGLSWPASQALVATVVPSRIRQRYFGINFALLNLGIGIGGIVGGLFIDVHQPGTFEAIYFLDAASYLPALFLLLVPLRHVTGRALHPEGEAKVSYLALMRRPAVLPMCLLSFVTALVGYAQLNAGMPAYARALGEVSTRGLGFAFAANTIVIVLLQLVVLRHIEGRLRTRVIAVMGLIWATAWALMGASSFVPGTWGATLLVAACASVFALGETLLQPTVPAIVNDLAPDHLRGRYNALSSAFFQFASVVGPPMAGLLIGHGLSAVYIALLVGGSVLVSLYAVARLEPHLPPAANGILQAGAASETEAAA